MQHKLVINVNIINVNSINQLFKTMSSIVNISEKNKNFIGEVPDGVKNVPDYKNRFFRTISFVKIKKISYNMSINSLIL